MAFCRIDAQATRTREAMTHPDVLIVQDLTLLYQVELFAGLLREGYLLISLPFSLDELGIKEGLKSMSSDPVCVVLALEIRNWKWESDRDMERDNDDGKGVFLNKVTVYRLEKI